MTLKDDLTASYSELVRQRDSASEALATATAEARAAHERSDLARIRYENLNAAVEQVAGALLIISRPDKVRSEP